MTNHLQFSKNSFQPLRVLSDIRNLFIARFLHHELEGNINISLDKDNPERQGKTTPFLLEAPWAPPANPALGRFCDFYRYFNLRRKYLGVAKKLKSASANVHLPHRSINPIVKFIFFELLGIALFVALSKFVLSALLWYFHNIHKETFFGTTGDQTQALITPGEFIIVFGIMIIFALIFANIYKDIESQNWRKEVLKPQWNRVDIAYMEQVDQDDMDES